MAVECTISLRHQHRRLGGQTVSQLTGSSNVDETKSAHIECEEDEHNDIQYYTHNQQDRTAIDI